jgi:hypothetical protein
MKERSEIIECIRGEIVGPARPVADPVEISFAGLDFIELEPKRRGAVVWRKDPDAELGEVLYYDRESPHRKYVHKQHQDPGWDGQVDEWSGRDDPPEAQALAPG